MIFNSIKESFRSVDFLEPSFAVSQTAH